MLKSLPRHRKPNDEYHQDQKKKDCWPEIELGSRPRGGRNG